MKDLTLGDLQESIVDKTAFGKLEHYFEICCSFLSFVNETHPTRIISPSNPHYVFYQYDIDYGSKITRPINTDLFINSVADLQAIFERFVTFLNDLKHFQQAIVDYRASKAYLESNEINRVIYTIQQSIGSISDSFDNSNQSRKRAGQLFETLIKLIIKEIGLECEPRTVNLPIPGYPNYKMSYELDLVFSRNKAIITSETEFLHSLEIVGSVKTTSKDRIDKIFLDKYLLTRLLGRDIPVIAIFLHDVQRAKKGKSIFGINSTFKTNHFLGYTVALNKLDGIYYVDPRPIMISDNRLREQIKDFQCFLAIEIGINFAI